MTPPVIQVQHKEIIEILQTTFATTVNKIIKETMAMLAGIEMELKILITTAATVEMVGPTIPTVAFKQMINVPYQDTMAIHGENAFKMQTIPIVAMDNQVDNSNNKDKDNTTYVVAAIEMQT